MKPLQGLRAMRHYGVLTALQFVLSAGLLAASVLFLFMLPPATAFEPARHLPLWGLSGALLAFTLVFWRTVDPQLNRIGLELLPNIIHKLLAPAACAWWVLGVGAQVLVMARPERASRWVFAPMLAAGTVTLLLCAGVCVLTWVLVSREQQDIARAQATLETFRKTTAPAELGRIESWIEWRMGETGSTPPSTIRGPFFPGMERRAWYDSARFDWTPELEAALPKVKEELLAIYGARADGEFRKYNYPGSLDKNWKVFPLFRDHHKVEANCARCPETTRLVERITGGLTRDVLISLLEPHAYIAPHRDSGNLFLTGHYGLVIPPDCGLRVGEETRVWTEGRSLVFDTSYEHEAWNKSDGSRVVLLYEFAHPDMTEVERRYFRALFKVVDTAPAGQQLPRDAVKGAA